MTAHVLDLLPLWVEGDLEPQDQASVDAHLLRCSACRAASEQLRASQAWLRTGLASPFTEADRSNLRDRVMTQIRAEAAAPPAPKAPRPALLLASAASLLMVSLVWSQRHRLWSPVGPKPLPSVAQAPPTAPLDSARAADAAVSEPTFRPRPHPHAPHKPEAEPLPRDGPARIEFQTDDPTIRIIWLAQAKPLPESTSSHPETP